MSGRSVLACAALCTACGFREGALASDAAGGGDVELDGSSLCFDVGGLISFCLQSPPSGVLSVSSTKLDTNTGIATPAIAGLTCAPLASSSQPVCVIAADSITISVGQTLRAAVPMWDGKPLVLVASSTMLIFGTVDVSSPLVGAEQGAGSDPSTGCHLGTTATGRAGGQGGSFGSQGGGGGSVGGTTSTGGKAGAVTVPATLRGGCQGGDGGGTTNYPHGRGGGAVALIAPTISLGASSRIDASGGPALGAPQGQIGGSGGGSGGLIVLDTQALTIAPGAQVFANGASGSAGSNLMEGGSNGGEPGFSDGGTTAVAPGAAGNGGIGAFGTTNATNGQASGNFDGGGGGGGGYGVIRVLAPPGYLTNVFSPAPSS